MAMQKKNCGKLDCKDFTFSLTEIADLLNKPSAFIKKELKQLQWIVNEGKKYDQVNLRVSLLSQNIH